MSEYLASLAERQPALAKHGGAIERVRRLRDRVKHDGIIPSAEDARSAAAEVESFVRAALTAVLGLTMEEVGPAQLVSDAQSKAKLVGGEAAFRSGDYAGATVAAAVAFALGGRAVFGRVDRNYLGDTHLLGVMGDLLPRVARAATEAEGAISGKDGAAVRRFAHAFARALSNPSTERHRFDFDQFAEWTRFANVGVDTVEMDRFRQIITPRVRLSANATPHVYPRMPGVEPTREETAFALDFVARSLLRAEEWLRRNPQALDPWPARLEQGRELRRRLEESLRNPSQGTPNKPDSLSQAASSRRGFCRTAAERADAR